MMKKETMNVKFEAGEGREVNGGVNYMLTADGTVYAEVPVDDGAAEDYGYMALKKAIQNVWHGEQELCFLYDGQEEHLSKEAFADAKVYLHDDQDPEDAPDKYYRVKPEHYDAWGASEITHVVTEKEIKRLAAEWDKTKDELMEQVEEIDLPTVDEAIQIIEQNQIYLDSDDKFALAGSLAQNNSANIDLLDGSLYMIVDPDTGECYADLFRTGGYANIYDAIVRTDLIRAMVPGYNFPFYTK